MNPVETPPPAAGPIPPAPPSAEADWGDPDDIHARIMLLDWISSQASALGAKPGQHILGTEWRILGVGDDPEELHRRVLAAEPGLASARLVGYRVTLDQW